MFLLSLPMRERGLKFSFPPLLALGAWSLPMRERGLKWKHWEQFNGQQESLPMRERGLKYWPVLAHLGEQAVAPHAGAWIEIYINSTASKNLAGRSPCGSVD